MKWLKTAFAALLTTDQSCSHHNFNSTHHELAATTCLTNGDSCSIVISLKAAAGVPDLVNGLATMSPTATMGGREIVGWSDSHFDLNWFDLLIRGGPLFLTMNHGS